MRNSLFFISVGTPTNIDSNLVQISYGGNYSEIASINFMVFFGQELNFSNIFYFSLVSKTNLLDIALWTENTN